MGFIADLIGKKSVTAEKTAPKRINHKSKYRGVQVNPRAEDCCEVVRAAVGTRYLSNNVPTLPLEGCDAVDCNCTYELFDDRRTDYRRAVDVMFGIASQLWRRDKRSSTSAGRRNED